MCGTTYVKSQQGEGKLHVASWCVNWATWESLYRQFATERSWVTNPWSLHLDLTAVHGRLQTSVHLIENVRFKLYSQRRTGDENVRVNTHIDGAPASGWTNLILQLSSQEVRHEVRTASTTTERVVSPMGCIAACVPFLLKAHSGGHGGVE